MTTNMMELGEQEEQLPSSMRAFESIERPQLFQGTFPCLLIGRSNAGKTYAMLDILKNWDRLSDIPLENCSKFILCHGGGGWQPLYDEMLACLPKSTKVEIHKGMPNERIIGNPNEIFGNPTYSKNPNSFCLLVADDLQNLRNAASLQHIVNIYCHHNRLISFLITQEHGTGSRSSSSSDPFLSYARGARYHIVWSGLSAGLIDWISRLLFRGQPNVIPDSLEQCRKLSDDKHRAFIVIDTGVETEPELKIQSHIFDTYPVAYILE